jgi:peptidoglycan/xylan/chitin deacetylase (PgdA/CDA1 family)
MSQTPAQAGPSGLASLACDRSEPMSGCGTTGPHPFMAGRDAIVRHTSLGESAITISKRDWLSGVSAGLGLTRLLESLIRRPCLVVFNYHRVTSPDSCPYDHAVIEATPEEFDDQLAFLKKRYNVIDLEEVQALAEKRSPLRHRHALVTLDDGYRDGYDVALPILKSRGIRATFFLTTGFIDTNKVPWWDQVAFVVRNTEQRRLRLRYPGDVFLNLDELGADRTIQRLLKLYKHPETTNPGRFLAEVEEACNVPRPSEAPERLFLSWQEVEALALAGMAIGSHTHTHPVLAKLTAEEQQQECELSRDLLREKLSRPVEALAFPVGSRQSFSETTLQCVRAAGYRLAFSYYGGVNTRGMDPFNILRMSIDRMSVAQHRLRSAVAGTTAGRAW